MTELFPRDVVAWTNEQLDRHLEKARFLRVEDPHNLPPAFIQRLRDRKPANPRPSSPPGNDPTLGILFQSGTLSLPTAEEEYLEDLRLERLFYYLLTVEGGRPWYPIHLLDEVSKDPEDYPEILSYWQFRADGWMVFGKQLKRWREFGDRQRYYREKDRFPKYILEVQERLGRYGFSRTFRLEQDATRQDTLTTWIEYLHYEHFWRDLSVHNVEVSQRLRDIADRKLVDSGVLRRGETVKLVLAREAVRQESQEEVEGQEVVAEAEADVKKALISIHKAKYGSRRSASTLDELGRVLTAAQSRRDETIESLEPIRRRDAMIRELGNERRDIQHFKEDIDHKDILIRWILEQIILIEAEMTGSKGVEGALGLCSGLVAAQDGGRDSINDRGFDEEKLVIEEPRSPSGGHGTWATLRVGRKRRSSNVEDDEPPRRRVRQTSGSVGVAAGRQQGTHPTKSGSAAGEHDEGEKAPPVSTANGPAKRGKPSPRKSHMAAQKPPTIAPPVRSSVRIAARRDQLKNVAARLGATKDPPRASRRKPAKTSGRTARRGVASVPGAVLQDVG